jgi:uncharacterized protein YndB with AHSA1/START domain
MVPRSARLAAALAAAILCGVTRVRAEVVPAEPYGFRVSHTLTIAAPPERVWAAIGRIGAWWSSEHAFSRDSHNFSLSLGPGGCWCERLPGGGGARHMTVIAVEPGRLLDLEGDLGPLAEPGAPHGHLMVSLGPDPKGARVVVTFEGGGFARDGYAQWAPPVDRVLGEQALRLRRYVETGRPD